MLIVSFLADSEIDRMASNHQNHPKDDWECIMLVAIANFSCDAKIENG